MKTQTWSEVGGWALILDQFLVLWRKFPFLFNWTSPDQMFIRTLKVSQTLFLSVKNNPETQKGVRVPPSVWLFWRKTPLGRSPGLVSFSWTFIRLYWKIQKKVYSLQTKIKRSQKTQLSTFHLLPFSTFSCLQDQSTKILKSLFLSSIFLHSVYSFWILLDISCLSSKCSGQTLIERVHRASFFTFGVFLTCRG